MVEGYNAPSELHKVPTVDGPFPRPGHSPDESELSRRSPGGGSVPKTVISQWSTKLRASPSTFGSNGCAKSSRKEVIQPHLPVRLPCYDFVPIAGPTFDGSPPCGLGHRLRVLPTFMT